MDVDPAEMKPDAKMQMEESLVSGIRVKNDNFINPSIQVDRKVSDMRFGKLGNDEKEPTSSEQLLTEDDLDFQMNTHFLHEEEVGNEFGDEENDEPAIANEPQCLVFENLVQDLRRNYEIL